MSDKIKPAEVSTIERSPSGSGSSAVEEHEQHEEEHEARSSTGQRPDLKRVKSYASAAEGYAHEDRIDGLLSRQETKASTMSKYKQPEYEVDWEDEDRGNPKQWSMLRKSLIIAVMSYATTTVVLYSTAYASDLPGLQSAFGISDVTGVLGVTTYMFGIAAGSLVLAPLSEMYGRRPIYIAALGCFVLFCLPSALAQNIETILITRFFGAFAGSAMISNAPGTVNDIVIEKYRALAFSLWSVGPMAGPVWGPLVGGFTYQYLGWRWTSWMVMLLAGFAFFCMLLIPETYAPTLLRKRAAKLRKENNDDRWWTRYDETKSFLPLLRDNLSRPFVLMVTEPICMFWDIFNALIYGNLYLCFVAYPIVFSDLRGWSPSISALAFMGVGVGTFIIIAVEPLLRRLIDSHKIDPETGEVPPEAMVSVVVIGAVLLAVGQLWFAWTCTPDHHWILPIAAGIPFGAGNIAVFIYSNNYLVHSYGMYAASALAGNAVLRSMLGGTLPLAGPALYGRLGPNWAGCLMGLIEVLFIPIPVIFYLFGHKIRRKSPLITRMRDEERRLLARRAQHSRNASVVSKAELQDLEKDIEKRGEAEAMTGFGMQTGAAIAENLAEVEAKKL